MIYLITFLLAGGLGMAQLPAPGSGIGGSGGGGSGDVVGPASSLDNEVAIYNSTTGKLLKRGTGCTINTTTAVMTCTGGFTSGDGTKTSKIDFNELIVNGLNVTSIYGPDALSADSCYVMPTAVSTSGQALADSGSITNTTETVSRPCRQLVWSSNIANATALAANGANCSAGQFPLGVDASGVSETCTALPTTIAGTANEVTASAATGAVTLSLAATLDFSAKTSTKTHKTGTTPPGTCAVGESFQDTDATATAQWYLCTATNTWTAQGGGGGSSVWSAGTKLVHSDPVSTRITMVATSSTVTSDSGGGTCPQCRTTLVFPNTAGTPAEMFVVSYPLDSRYFTNGAVNVSILTATVASGVISFDVSPRCVARGATFDPSWGGVQTISSGSITSGNLAESVGAVTVNCSAGDLLEFAVVRNVSDANTGSVYVHSIGVYQ